MSFVSGSPSKIIVFIFFGKVLNLAFKEKLYFFDKPSIIAKLNLFLLSQPGIAPLSMDIFGNFTIRARSKSVIVPSPLHFSQAPSGLLKEKRLVLRSSPSNAHFLHIGFLEKIYSRGVSRRLIRTIFFSIDMANSRDSCSLVVFSSVTFNRSITISTCRPSSYSFLSIAYRSLK